MTLKDERTTRIREAILDAAPAAIEDARAGEVSTLLSFRSDLLPARHVWIDTDLAGKLIVELEDCDHETMWDNTVARLEAEEKSTPSLVQAWLQGASVEAASGLASVTFMSYDG